MLDELEVLSKIFAQISCTRGVLDPCFSSYIPDISLKIHDKLYAIAIFTNISPGNDESNAKSIQKQWKKNTSFPLDLLFKFQLLKYIERRLL